MKSSEYSKMRDDDGFGDYVILRLKEELWSVENIERPAELRCSVNQMFEDVDETIMDELLDASCPHTMWPRPLKIGEMVVYADIRFCVGREPSFWFLGPWKPVAIPWSVWNKFEFSDDYGRETPPW